MIVGFSGTRLGMTLAQVGALGKWLVSRQHQIEAVHHGGCVGADEQLHALVQALDVDVPLHVHWGDVSLRWVAKLQIRPIDFMYEPKPPLERNVDIVLASSVLTATPEFAAEQLRSGTWATVRRARELAVPRLIFTPSGVVVEEVDLP